MALQQCALKANQISIKLSYAFVFITDYSNVRKEESKPPKPSKRKEKMNKLSQTLIAYNS